MPALVRLYIRQVLIGFALSAVLVGAYLWLNVANLWHLVSHSDMGWLAVLMLWVFHGIVLAAVQFGIRIMAMAEEEGGQGGGRAVTSLAAAVPVLTKARRDG